MGHIARGALLVLLAVRAVSFRGRGLALVWIAGLLLKLFSQPLPRPRAAACAACAAALLLLVTPLAGQAQDTLHLTLGTALERAQEGSERIALAQAGVLRARGERYQSRSGFLPRIATSLGYTRTLKSEFEALRMPASDSGSGGNPFEGLELPFGQANRYDLGVTASQTVFAGGQLLAQHRITGSSLRNAETALAGARAELELEVTRAYFDAALSDRLLAIADSSLAQAAATLQQVRAAQDVGDRAEFEVLRAQVARDNQRPQVIARRADRDLAYMRLRQLLNLPLDRPLELGLNPNLVVSREARGGPAGDVVLPIDTAVAARASVRQAAELVHVREQQARIAFAQRLPSVGVTTQYGRVGYPRAGLPEWEQLRSNWTVGVQLQLPVFTGGRIRGDELRAEADVAEARARLEQARELAALDGRSALEQLDAAQAAWEASAGTVEQAARAYRIAEIRWREGLSTQLELNDARLMLQQAEANRAVAERDLEVARTVVRLLPDLPIGMNR